MSGSASTLTTPRVGNLAAYMLPYPPDIECPTTTGAYPCLGCLVQMAGEPASDHADPLARHFPFALTATLDPRSREDGRLQALGIRQADLARTGRKLGHELAASVKPPAQHGQHRVPRQRHGQGFGIAGRVRSALEGAERYFCLADPGQLHQRDEAPEQARSLADPVTRGASKLDQRSRRFQPVPGAGRIPQRIQARVEHLGQHRVITCMPGQAQRLIREGSPARQGKRVAEELAGHPCEQHGPAAVVRCPREGCFEQPDQAVVYMEKLTALHCVQGKVHKRITPGGQTLELARQLARRTRQSARGDPDSVPLRGRPVADDRRQLALIKPGKLRVTAHPKRRCRRGHDRGRANDNPRCDERKYLQRIRAPDIKIVDDDQPPLTGGQRPERCARCNWIVLMQQPPRGLLFRPGIGEQLRPEQAPRLAPDGCGAQNLEPAAASPVRGRPDQHCLAGSGRPEEVEDPARPSRCRFQEHIDLTEFGRPPHRLHMPESRASELARPTSGRPAALPASGPADQRPGSGRGAHG